jgi:hypothetical protein
MSRVTHGGGNDSEGQQLAELVRKKEEVRKASLQSSDGAGRSPLVVRRVVLRRSAGMRLVMSRAGGFVFDSGVANLTVAHPSSHPCSPRLTMLQLTCKHFVVLLSCFLTSVLSCLRLKVIPHPHSSPLDNLPPLSLSATTETPQPSKYFGVLSVVRLNAFKPAPSRAVQGRGLSFLLDIFVFNFSAPSPSPTAAAVLAAVQPILPNISQRRFSVFFPLCPSNSVRQIK